MSVDLNLQALQAFSIGMAVTANNIANMNTNEFKSSRADLETGPYGQGVQVAAIRQDDSPGPLVESLSQSDNNLAERASPRYDLIEASNTDLTREMVHMIGYQNAFDANIAAIRTQEEMVGTLINQIV